MSNASHLHRQLLDQARQLAIEEPKKPKQGNLRRAVSSAYYSLFHFLIHESTRSLIGSNRDRRPLRNVLSRAFHHRTMASASKAFEMSSLPDGLSSTLGTVTIPVDVQEVAASFLELQEQRHKADYDLSSRFFRPEVLSLIARVDAVMKQSEMVKVDRIAILYLGSLLTRDRLRGRKK